MRVCLDARMVGFAPHGIARYADRLLRHLPEADRSIAWTALVAPGAGPRWEGVETVEASSPLYGLREQIEVPRLLARLGVDLFHSPTFSAPLRAPCPSVMTIHDLIHLRDRRSYGLGHRAYYRWVVGPAARRARRVITVSETSRRDLEERLRIPPDRISVIPHGLADEWRHPPAAARARGEARRWGIGGAPWFLWVGNPKPHKGLDLLLRAWALRGGGPEILVVVGAPIPAGGGAGRIVRLEGVGDDDLRCLYAGAVALVAPSRWEGFNLPLLEAMACGAPVVASDLPAHREVAGPAALYVPVGEAGALARALHRVARDRKLRTTLSAAGLRRSRSFRVEEEVRRTLRVYHDSIGPRA